MELTGFAAVALVGAVFVVGFAAGFAFAGWNFAMLIRRSGYRLNEHNQLERTDE
jgi:hypothetical protein